MENILDNIDRTVDPSVVFFKFATGKWLENNPKQLDYAMWNVFAVGRNKGYCSGN